MIAKRLHIKNYRNCISGIIEFDKNVNIFIGDNAQGKTNILEALYIFSCQKSFRGAKNRYLINWNKDFLELVLEFESEGFDKRAVIRMFKNKNKENFLNGVKQKKASDMVGLIKAVLFAPEHLTLIKQGPSERRKFINLALSQIDRDYFFALLEHKKIIDQKNAYLKKDKAAIDRVYLDVLNQKISAPVSIIMQKRKEFIEKLSKTAQKNHYEISKGTEKLELFYNPNIKTENIGKDNIYEQVKKFAEREISLGLSLIGPHRDDIDFLINNRPARDFASQGQQRSAVLCVKLAECELFYQKSAQYPILLLDDIMSELDTNRQNYIINKIKNIQVMITCCDTENIKGFENGKKFFIKDGVLS